MSITYADTRDRYRSELVALDRSPYTIKAYLQDMKSFARWYQAAIGEEMTPDHVTPADVREYRSHLLANRAAPTTINRKLVTLQGYLNWAVNAGLREPTSNQSGLEGVKRIQLETPGPRWLERGELLALQRAAEKAGKREAALVTLLVHTGLRVGELCALVHADIRVRSRKGVLVVRQGKGRKHREIPLNGSARDALTNLGAGRKTADEKLIWGQRGPMTSRGVDRMFRRLGRKAKLEDFSPHVLRHTFAKSLINAGIPIEQVATLLGHNSLETTRRYVTPSADDLERAVDTISSRDD